MPSVASSSRLYPLSPACHISLPYWLDSGSFWTQAVLLAEDMLQDHAPVPGMSSALLLLLLLALLLLALSSAPQAWVGRM
jgi:hypothetical protein